MYPYHFFTRLDNNRPPCLVEMQAFSIRQILVGDQNEG